MTEGSTTSWRMLESPAEDDGPNLMAEIEAVPDTFTAYGRALRDAAPVYQKKLDDWKQDALNRVVILGLEAATTGRNAGTWIETQLTHREDNAPRTCGG